MILETQMLTRIQIGLMPIRTTQMWLPIVIIGGIGGSQRSQLNFCGR
jgi:hypothetical protein